MRGSRLPREEGGSEGGSGTGESVDQSKVWRPEATWQGKECGLLTADSDEWVDECRGGGLPGEEGGSEWRVGSGRASVDQ